MCVMGLGDMGFGGKLVKGYFNLVYNPVYDLTTARLPRYRELQGVCIDKLELEDNDRVLCAGLGTGNEVGRILRKNRNVDIVGIDYSATALKKACRKALKLGKSIEVLEGDVRCMQFPSGSFDKVLCLHVMDFLEDHHQATSEVLRVLRRGGRFAVTYPSEKEGLRLGFSLMSDGLRGVAGCQAGHIKTVLDFVLQVLVGFVYLPLMLRPRRRSYTCGQVKAVFAGLTQGDFGIEEYPGYQDFLVFGRK